MTRLRYLSCVGLVVVCLQSLAHSQPVVGFDLRLLRPGFPTFDGNPVLQGSAGEMIEFTAELSITTLGMADRSVQGWSLSLKNSGLDILSLSDEGAVIRDQSRGGLFDGGFLKNEIVDPGRRDQGQGMVQACVLSLFRPVALPVDARSVVGINRYRARLGAGPMLGSIRFEDALQGSGQPVANNVTIAGASALPRLRSRSIALGGGAPLPEERCDDGVDNDRNGVADCDDRACLGDVACGFEDCSDGIDNDQNGAVDCDDPACSSFTVACDEPELCDDGIDNDRDGALDCSDGECAYLGDCPGPEICGEGIDNDLDGKTDCEDFNCVGVLPCAGYEICDNGVDDSGDGRVDCDDEFCIRFTNCTGNEICGDGIDNDLDGLTDWRDPQCECFPGCIGPEVCSDGKDNDFDGKVDCDDSACAGVAPCPDPEICGDGIDNDKDGKIDCTDPQCFGILSCPSPEVCNDRVDNDQDGRTDCDDPDCARLPACRVAERCTDGLDNDGDFLTDCDDFDCRRNLACVGREVCDDGIDNDQNGSVDCDDLDCAAADLCSSAGGGGGYDMVIIADDSVFENEEYVTFADPRITTGIPVTVYIFARGGGAGSGVQGWSLSITHDRDLIGFDPNGGAPTISGTDAERFFSGGFRKTEVARDPAAAGNGGGGAGDEDGFISAVVLSFTEPQVLPPRGAHSIARARYILKDGFGAPGVGAVGVVFKDGLRGSGQPVTNSLTVDGATLKPARLLPLKIQRAALTAPFVRGDSNVDHKVNVADAIWVINELLRQGPRSQCPRASDVNADGLYDLADAMFLIQWMFLSGSSIPRPYPGCGTAPGPEALDCPENVVPYCR